MKTDGDMGEDVNSLEKSAPRELESVAVEGAERGDAGGWGELPWHEVVFRGGLLLGAGLFFSESPGWPWDRNLFGVAALVVSALIVTTLVFQWRVLGDWRRRTQQALYVLLVLVLTFPVAAALSPSLGTSAIPDYIEAPVMELLARLQTIPGTSMLLGFLRGFLSFLFLAVTLMVLLLAGGPGRRGGLLFIAAVLVAICLFFHPTLECVTGFILLGLFLHNEWEAPLLIPDRVRAALEPSQTAFLRELARAGSLSTGETRLYLENRPELFAELLDYRLVEYDSIARDVLPGRRFLQDPASEAIEKALGYLRRATWLAVGVMYFLLPDLVPGPIDDVIIMALCAASGFNLFGKAARR